MYWEGEPLFLIHHVPDSSASQAITPMRLSHTHAAFIPAVTWGEKVVTYAGLVNHAPSTAPIGAFMFWKQGAGGADPRSAC